MDEENQCEKPIDSCHLEYQKRDSRIAIPPRHLEKSVICGGHVCPNCRRCCDWKWNGQNWTRVGNGCNHSDVRDRVSGFDAVMNRLLQRKEPPRVHVLRSICDCKQMI